MSTVLQIAAKYSLVASVFRTCKDMSKCAFATLSCLQSVVLHHPHACTSSKNRTGWVAGQFTRSSQFLQPCLLQLQPSRKRPRHCTRTAPVAVDSGSLPFVGEALELLAATTFVIPLFRRFKLSPILGFLVAGVVLGPHGLRLIKDVEDITELAEFGVLFLLFEMGLQLNIDRLRKLRKYAFGMGFLQVSLSSAILGLGAYGMGASLPEAAVIGTALSLSSSAFILQLLGEKGERQSRAGVATFGVLLFQGTFYTPASRFVLSPVHLNELLFLA